MWLGRATRKPSMKSKLSPVTTCSLYLRDDIEVAVESNTRPPVAAVNGPYSSIEGETVAMSADQSSDADGDALTYAWSFGDGGSASGVDVSHTYASAGTYTVRLIATDIRGLADTVNTTATVASWSQSTGTAIAMLDQLAAAGKISSGNANSLRVTLEAAKKQFERGHSTPAVNQLEAFINHLDALVGSGQVLGAVVVEIRAFVTRIIQAAS